MTTLYDLTKRKFEKKEEVPKVTNIQNSPETTVTYGSDSNKTPVKKYNRKLAFVKFAVFAVIVFVAIGAYLYYVKDCNIIQSGWLSCFGINFSGIHI